MSRSRRWGWWSVTGLALLLAVVLVVTLAGKPFAGDRDDAVRTAAADAIGALRAGDLAALDEKLAAHRGQSDFAYFFASEVTPRELGDALSAVAGATGDAPLKAGVDPHAYDLTLTDLAGTLALATHGVEDRALPASWSDDFIKATTDPATLYGGFGSAADEAHKQNLLLLLSRGYWSSEFLQAVTQAYWDFDHAKGDAAWPGAVLGATAPAPNGAYLTDGVLALTAALTANPEASRWAFTEFQPGTTPVEGTDKSVGRFTHYLLFAHRFPTSSSDDGGDTIGMTAALTALSSAIDASAGAPEGQVASAGDGPMADAIVLQGLAKNSTDEGGGSIWSKPFDAVTGLAGAVWHWIQHWGHRVLDILSLAPLPFGTVAASASAAWYTIEGDYANAGLALAAVVPALAFVKIAKAGIQARKATKTAAEVDETAKKWNNVANAAKGWRLKPWKNCAQATSKGGLVLRYGPDWTRAQRRGANQKMKVISQAAQRGELRKTPVERSATYAQKYKNAGGTVPEGADVDHTIDLQLGGSDDISNLKPLDASVNRSFGIQIAQQLQALPYGHPVRAAAIC